ncbi:MAG: hypothetical protein IPK81_21230 [Rhodospirillales bacterium]|nr:MAG: hypothetical protein IPK81_21230 [Rhodospirillales bacterium]
MLQDRARFPRLAAGAALAVAAWLAAGPAAADSQSSNTSSNCSSGRCTRVDTYVIEDDRGSRGRTRVESWAERPRRGHAPVLVAPPPAYVPYPVFVPYPYPVPRGRWSGLDRAHHATR